MVLNADVKVVDNGLLSPEAIREALDNDTTKKVVDQAIYQLQATNSTLKAALSGGLSVASGAIQAALVGSVVKVVGDVTIGAMKQRNESYRSKTDQYRAETERIQGQSEEERLLEVQRSEGERILEQQRWQGRLNEEDQHSKDELRRTTGKYVEACTRGVAGVELERVASTMEEERTRLQRAHLPERFVDGLSSRMAEIAAQQTCEAVLYRVRDLLKRFPQSQVYMSVVGNGDMVRRCMEVAFEPLSTALARMYPDRVKQLDVNIFSSLQDAVNQHSCYFDAETVGFCKESFHDNIKRSLGYPVVKGRAANEHHQVFTLIGLVGTPNCVINDGEPYFWGDVAVPENLFCSALASDGMSYIGVSDLPGLQIVGPCEDGKPLHAVGSCTVATPAGLKTTFFAMDSAAQLDLGTNNATVGRWGVLTNRKDWDDSFKEEVAKMKRSRVIHLRQCLENVAAKENSVYMFADGRVISYGARDAVRRRLTDQVEGS